MSQPILKPQAGRQEQFLSTKADIAIYGGAAGGGKSFSLLLEPLRHIDVKGFGAVLFRRTYPQITNEGGLWDAATKMYSVFPNAYSSAMDWNFKYKGYTNKISFRHMQHDKNKYDWQGSEIPLIIFDELTHFEEGQFFYMLSRNRSLCGIKPYIRAATNPDPDSWVKKFIQWWIDRDTGLAIQERAGKIRYYIRVSDTIIWFDSKEEAKNVYPDYSDNQIKSVTFIPAKIEDNPKLLEVNPEYLGTLKGMPEYDRELLLNGNWNARPTKDRIFVNPSYVEWDSNDLYQIRAYCDPAYEGKDLTAISIGGISKTTKRYVIRGFCWRKGITELYEVITVLLKRYNVDLFVIESNGDNKLSAREFQKMFPRVVPYPERTNKHQKITHFIGRNWKQIDFANDCDNTYLHHVLEYVEGYEPDDCPDSLASLLRLFSQSGGIREESLSI